MNIHVLETIWGYLETRLCPLSGESSDPCEPERAQKEHIFTSAKEDMPQLASVCVVCSKIAQSYEQIFINFSGAIYIEPRNRLLN